jgi:HK97 family phage prohead protease
MEVTGKVKTIDLDKQNFKVANKTDRIIEGFFTTTDLDRGGDVSLTSAFEKTLPKYMQNPLLTYMHRIDKIMGKILEYKVVENIGIYVKAQVVKGVKWVDDEVWPLIEQGMLKGFSYGYSTLDEEEKTLDNGANANYLKEVDLYEIAVVSLPMNANAMFRLSTAGAVKGITIETKELETPESKGNKKEEEINVEQLKEILDALKSISEKLEAFKPQESPTAEDIAGKLAEILATQEQEKVEQKAKEQKETDEQEVINAIKEITAILTEVVTTITKEENKDE